MKISMNKILINIINKTKPINGKTIIKIGGLNLKKEDLEIDLDKITKTKKEIVFEIDKNAKSIIFKGTNSKDKSIFIEMNKKVNYILFKNINLKNLSIIVNIGGSLEELTVDESQIDKLWFRGNIKKINTSSCNLGDINRLVKNIFSI